MLTLRASKFLSKPKTKNIQLRNYRGLTPFGASYGPPSRASNSGISVTLFGSYGFLGRYMAHNLGLTGARVYAPFRGCELEVRILKTMFDHGQLGLIPFSTRDEESYIKALEHSDVVINYIGKHYETKHVVPTRRENGKLSRINFSFEEVHVDIPRRLARSAKKAGVKCFIHVSALSADLDSASIWSQTKAKGEIAVREEFPEAIIIRPATAFGHEDKFLNKIAEQIKSYKIFPVVNQGSNLIQPVNCNDVAKGIMRIMYDWRKYQGKTFQFAGPEEYTWKEIVEFISEITLMETSLVNVPSSLAYGAATIIEKLINPALTIDQLRQMTEDNILLDKPDLLTFKDLDYEPVSLEKIAFEYLYRFRPGGHFQLASGYHGDLKV